LFVGSTLSLAFLIRVFGSKPAFYYSIQAWKVLALAGYANRYGEKKADENSLALDILRFSKAFSQD